MPGAGQVAGFAATDTMLDGRMLDQQADSTLRPQQDFAEPPDNSNTPFQHYSALSQVCCLGRLAWCHEGLRN